jgi:hypothetical protein
MWRRASQNAVMRRSSGVICMVTVGFPLVIRNNCSGAVDGCTAWTLVAGDRAVQPIHANTIKRTMALIAARRLLTRCKQRTLRLQRSTSCRSLGDALLSS